MKPIFEKININQTQSIIAFKYAEKNFETPWHFHPQHELTYIVKSSGTKFIGDYVGPYESGELVLLSANLPHYWKNHPKEDELAESIVVQWNPTIFAKVPELKPLFVMLKNADKGLFFEKEMVGAIAPMLKKLPSLSGPALYLHFLNLLIRLTECSTITLSKASFIHHLPTEYSTRMSKIHDFVGKNYQRKIYLKDLAELINMTEQSFSRFFKKMMGRSFFVFLNEYRINYASRLLLETDLSVAEIGYQSGYESLPFFHKQFNKFKGQSPSKFRRHFAG